MDYKDILIYANDHNSATSRFDAAALLGPSGAHLTALHVATPQYLPVDLGTGVPPDLVELLDEIQEQQAASAQAVVNAAEKRLGRTIEWRDVRGAPVAETIADHARYADVVVMSQSSAEAHHVENDGALPGVVAIQAGRPVLVVPNVGTYKTLGRNVVIAWKPTRESARALHDALPILCRAKAVTIVEVNPENHGRPRLAGAEVAAHLARHDVNVTISGIRADDVRASDIILSRVSDLGADLIVMGAYGHSRLTEFALGGVTRQILASMTVPVLLSH